MSNRFLQALSTVIAVVLLAPLPAAGQVPKAATDGWMLHRTPDGQPDLQGVWDFRTITPLERPGELVGKAVLTEEEAAEFEQETLQARDHDGPPREGSTGTYNQFWWDYGTKLTEDNRTSLIVDPSDGKIPPLTPEGQQRSEARNASRGRPAAGPEDRSLWERCLTRSLPRLPGAYNNNLQIFQAADHVVILNEMIHEARVIPLRDQPHVDRNIRQWQGDSRGHWDGETLVVDTTHFTDKTNFRGSTDTLHLVERFTRVDADTLRYEATIEDATTFTTPWTIVVPMAKSEGRMFEYACHERNYGMEGILAGARADEQAAAGAVKTGSR
uniref:Uncharacterized protein n=1 Tax=uncultured gamma proteobacterium HF4000_48E10 TaxID=723583 RepID=E7C8S4_9GAMM|nr:hypothetical protein [uncultured gamma proteobacterium HF4000_48E10]